MASYLKPRRGRKSTAIAQNLLLKRGEIFFEIPESGIGTGMGKVKMGDGSKNYNQLPYFIDPTASASTATNAGTANYSNNSGTANYSKNASTANYSTSAGSATNASTANYSKNASTSTYSTKTATDTALSTTSTNPVQNKVVAAEIGALKQSFQDGCNTISNKITELGVSTATNSSPIIIANNIEILANNKYNEGVKDADARTNPDSNNYKAGYNAGKNSTTIKYIDGTGIIDHTDSDNLNYYGYIDISGISINKIIGYKVSCDGCNYIYCLGVGNLEDAQVTYSVGLTLTGDNRIKVNIYSTNGVFTEDQFTYKIAYN